MTATAPCPSCASENPAGSRFCSSCGQRIDVFSQAPTMVVRPEPAPRVARLISSDSVPAGGFAPGVVLVDRYRIIGLLGRGGMGEVYRADDLKLAQAVALKFLPQALADDPVRRERFFAEVRIARQLSHPNVCRVYDIGEYEGRHFLSMEYIDGEDLASLLQRIGHLSNEKAVDIARQLAAGLSAAHERGVLHRDLKPSNVMLDGLGRVRITDFGLAVVADDEAQATDVSGTPAYMAPEQLSGKGATIRSDIYSLGLILYEIYTAKRAFKATSIADLREQKATHTPTAPSDLRSGVDPVVERLIMRCLEREPGMRPSSVAQVAAALPGGDALAAAIAAGETPSPDLLIAAGPKEGLRPVVALCLLVFVIIGGLAAALMSDRIGFVQQAQLTKPPDALIDDARELLRKVGYTQTAVDDASGFFTDSDALSWVTECYFSSSCRADRIEHLEAAGVIGFFHRQSPRPLLGVGPFGGIGPDDPVMQYPGEVAVQLDGQGRLRAFRAVPPREESDAVSSTVDWSVLFSEAGLDITNWNPIDPRWTAPFYADTRMAWIGALPVAANVQVHIEAAAYRGRPVSFVMVGPWTSPVSVRGFAAGAQAPDPRVAAGATLLLVVLGTAGGFVARRNLRLGRGDRRGATRVMLFTLGCWFVSWMAVEHHVADVGEVLLVAGFAGMFLPLAGLLWVSYIAVEPFVRRRWPRLLVSWSRLLAGDWRDPVVGRDVLIGSAAGIASLDLMYGAMLSPSALGRSSGFSPVVDWNLFNGPLSLLGALLSATSFAIAQGLLALLTLLVLRVALRRDWAVAIVLGVGEFFTGPYIVELLWLPVMLKVAQAVVLVFVVVRVGLLASVVLLFFMFLALRTSITIQPSAWYAGISYAVLLVLAGITLYGFRTALGGRPMMGTLAIED